MYPVDVCVINMSSHLYSYVARILRSVKRDNVTPNSMVENKQIKLPNARGRLVEGITGDFEYIGPPVEKQIPTHRHVIIPDSGLFSLDFRAADTRFSVVVRSSSDLDTLAWLPHLWDSHSNFTLIPSQAVLFNSSHVEHIVRDNCSAADGMDAWSCALQLISAVVTTHSLALGVVVAPSSFEAHFLFSDSLRK